MIVQKLVDLMMETMKLKILKLISKMKMKLINIYFISKSQARTSSCHLAYNVWTSSFAYFSQHEEDLPMICREVYKSDKHIMRNYKKDLTSGAFKMVHEKLTEHWKTLFSQKFLDFISAARFFDPVQALQLMQLKSLKGIPFVTEYSLGNEISVYQSLISSQNLAESQYKDPRNWWIAKADKLPQLYKLALRVLQIPVTTAEVERSFSVYNTIVYKRRSNLSKDNTKASCFIKCNYDQLFMNI